MDHDSVSVEPCHICGKLAVEALNDFTELSLVTSDCKPWSGSGNIGVCRNCACVQKVVDARLRLDIENIYRSYTIYHQSQGAEQRVFESTGDSASRSEFLLGRFLETNPVPRAGRLLDIGCGNGTMFRAFAKFVPTWSMVGSEFDEKYRSVVESIQGVERLHTIEPYKIPGRFDLITMIHVLEHIEGPIDFLKRLRAKLGPGGLLLIQTPHFQKSPFDLIIADHITHFTAETLENIGTAAGYQILQLADNWVPEEFTAVLCVKDAQGPKPDGTLEANKQILAAKLRWLKKVVKRASRLSERGCFGLFGTSIAATWLFGELEGKVSFFVDEAAERAGKTHLGLPIFRPRDIPTGGRVFIGLPFVLAKSIKERLSREGISFYLPTRG